MQSTHRFDDKLYAQAGPGHTVSVCVAETFLGESCMSALILGGCLYGTAYEMYGFLPKEIYGSLVVFIAYCSQEMFNEILEANIVEMSEIIKESKAAFKKSRIK